MLTIEAQKGYVVAARFGCDDACARRLARTVETLARHRIIAYSTRNRVREELKLQGFALPRRIR